MAKKRVINIGIDLGTSKSVIACDNEKRTFMPSCIGFPKDPVSKKLLEKDIVFGEEAVNNRMALDLIRPIEKGVLKYSDSTEGEKEKKYKRTVHASKEYLKHLISLVTGQETGEFVLRGVIGTPSLSSRRNKKALLEIAGGVLDDIMIASEPFAVAYGLNMMSGTLVVDIGAGTIDLCRMHGTVPTAEDQRTTFKAGDFIDRKTLNLVSKKYKDASVNANMIRKAKESALALKEGERIFMDMPVRGKPVNCDITDELLAACRSIVPDIVEGIRELISTFDPEFQNGLKENVILAGGGSQVIGLAEEIENHMNETLGYGRVRKVSDPVYAGADGALKLCMQMPDEYWHVINSTGTNRT